jgi:predicted exporter
MVRKKEEFDYMKAFKLIPCLVVAACLAAGAASGCTKKPNKDDVAKLEEAKDAAENAEKKLYDLKQERMKLEAEKQKSQKPAEGK